MPARATCDECGTRLPANAPQWLRPKCLVAMGLNSAAATEQQRRAPPFLGEALEDSLLPLLNAERISPRLPDLETICLNCLNKDPQPIHRSASELADELADELDCFLQDQSIQARRANRVKKTRRWCSPNRVLASTEGDVFILLMTVGGAFANRRLPHRSRAGAVHTIAGIAKIF